MTTRSRSTSSPLRYCHPVLEDLLDRGAAARRTEDVIALGVAGSTTWLACGVGVVLVGSELGYIAAGFEEAWQTLSR